MYPIYSCVRVLGCAYAAFDRGFLKNYVLHCHGFVLHMGSSDLYCHSTVLLLFWILSYFRVKENVIVWLLLFGRFRVKLRGSVLLTPQL